METALMVRIEAEVDAHGLEAVLQALEDVCGYKAEHLRSNWQDEPLAACWDGCAMHLSSRPLSPT